MPTGRRNTEEDFWVKVDRTGGEDACWPWMGRLHRKGYGFFNWKGSIVLAHRLSYELTKGPLVNWALHSCDNPCCCNPRHLYDGTAQQNAHDRESRGRGGGHLRRGEKQGAAKLSWKVIPEIKRLYFEEGFPYWKIAEKNGVSVDAIRDVIIGKTWKEPLVA